MTLILLVILILLLGGVGLAVDALWWLLVIALALVIAGSFRQIGRW